MKHGPTHAYLIVMACFGSAFLFSPPSAAQTEARHKLTSVLPCPEDSNQSQNIIRLDSTPEAVAAGALSQYEFLAAMIVPHDPAKEKVTAKTHILASNGPVCDGYWAMNVTMHMLLETAFGFDRDYVIGAPKWTDDENYDVRLTFSNATIDAINELGPVGKNRAVRAALAPFLGDRVKLAARRSTAQMPVYELVVGKKGPKFHESTQRNTSSANLTVFTDNHGGYVLTGRAARIDTLAAPLQKVLGRKVLDKTGLTGLYDFVLTFDPQAQTFASQSQMKPRYMTPEAIYTKAASEAIDKQLGLKLNSSLGAVEVLAIDHIEKPAKN